MRKILFVLCVLVASLAMAIEIPKASGKALGVTKGKSFSEGLVFVNGKYIEPPYVVERWGVGIRINGTPVIGQVIDWTEFIKTQPGAKVTKSESAPAEAPEEPEEEEEEEELDDYDYDDDLDSSLDDLFDDDPKPAKKAAPKKAAKKKAKKRAPKPTTTISYTLEGDFVPNDASKALVTRINKLRTDLNSTLLKGGILIFGDRYSRIAADSHSAEQVLSALPDLQKNSSSAAELASGARAAGLVYLSAPVCADLFANKVDYLKLQRRRAKWQEAQKVKKLLNGSNKKSLL